MQSTRALGHPVRSPRTKPRRLAASQGKRAQNAVLKHEALQHRLVAAQAAEDAKMAQFRALLGASGGAIQIPKRL